MGYAIRSLAFSIALAALAAVTLAVRAQSADAPAAGAAAGSAVTADQAKALWDKDCASCHGADGKAKSKMGELLKVRDLTDPAVHATLTREGVTKAIKEGVKKEGGDKLIMPAFASKLSDAEVTALVDYVLALK